MSFWEKAKGFFLSPAETFNSVKDEGLTGSLTCFAKCLLVYAILGIVVSLIPPELYGALIPLEWAGVFGVFFLAAALLGLWALHPVVFISWILITMISILIGSVWMHIWVYIVGGRNGLKQTIKAMVYGSTPLLLLGWIPFLGKTIFGIWTLVVQVIGIRQLHELSTGRAFLAYVIGIIILPAIPIAVFLIILLRAIGGPYLPS